MPADLIKSLNDYFANLDDLMYQYSGIKTKNSNDYLYPFSDKEYKNFLSKHKWDASDDAYTAFLCQQAKAMDDLFRDYYVNNCNLETQKIESISPGDYVLAYVRVCLEVTQALKNSLLPPCASNQA